MRSARLASRVKTRRRRPPAPVRETTGSRPPAPVRGSRARVVEQVDDAVRIEIKLGRGQPGGDFFRRKMPGLPLLKTRRDGEQHLPAGGRAGGIAGDDGVGGRVGGRHRGEREGCGGRSGDGDAIAEPLESRRGCAGGLHAEKGVPAFWRRQPGRLLHDEGRRGLWCDDG